MATLLFPDNTVLINFALINRMDLLERLANGNGCWCASVALECNRSAKQPGLDALRDAPRIFGSPLYPETGAERLTVEAFRTELARPGDQRHAHLGESETLAIMTHRELTAFFVTDDREAARLARKYRVTVVSTWQLLKVAVKHDFVDTDTAWGYVLSLRSRKRGSPRGVTDRAGFDAWVTE